MPNPAKRKGDRIERLLISLLTQAGIRATKISRCGHPGGDIYLEPAAGEGGLVAEAKARAEPIKTIDNWLKGQSDLVILRPDRAEPQVFMPWRTFILLMEAYQDQPLFVGVRPVGDAFGESTLGEMPGDEVDM